MRAITLYEPWASLIAIGAKTIETRLDNRFKSLDCSSGERFGLMLEDPILIKDSGIIRGKQGIWTWETGEQDIEPISYL